MADTKTPTKTWFVTGTDTEIGKTFATTRLLTALNEAKMPANGYKPVASGAEMTEIGLKNPDAYQHLLASFDDLSYEDVNPYFFEAEEAPHILADEAGIAIEFAKITQGLRHLEAIHENIRGNIRENIYLENARSIETEKSNIEKAGQSKPRITLVEGAGGWYTPLSFKESYSDWVVENQLPVIVVVGLKLGVINHARLTFDAIENAGLKITGWIANHLSDSKSLQNYIAGIQAFTDIPMIGEIPYQAELNDERIVFDLSVFEK